MSSMKVNWRSEQSDRGGLGRAGHRKWFKTYEDGKTRIVDAPTYDGKARPHRSGGCNTFLARPNVDLQGDQGRTLANSQIRHTHYHHALRSGVLLGKPAGREITCPPFRWTARTLRRPSRRSSVA